MTKLKELLDNYNQAQLEIYNYFSFEQEWHIYPIEDSTEYEWYVTTNEVIFANNLREDYVKENYYSVVLHRNTILLTELYTAIIGDTQTDGNILFMIFDNKKEIKDL